MHSGLIPLCIELESVENEKLKTDPSTVHLTRLFTLHIGVINLVTMAILLQEGSYNPAIFFFQ